MKIFDFHLYFGESLFGRDFREEEFKRFQEKHPDLEGGLISNKPYEYFYFNSNQHLKKCCPEKWSHFLRVDPWRREEALYLIESYTAPVLFLHPFEEQFYPTHSLVKSVVEAAAAKNMAVMIATGYLPFSHSAQVMPLVKAFPQVPFILTHGGQLNISGLHMSEAWEIFEQCENTYFETSGIYRQDYIDQALRKLGEDRILFGSATPLFHFEYELKRIELLECSDSAREKILYGNGKRLAGN